MTRPGLKLAILAGLAGTAWLLKPRRHGRPHEVVIVGAGFGGLQAAEGLARTPGLHVTLIDRGGEHLFQPLLYQVATAALGPEEITAPVRSILAGARRVRSVTATVTGVDHAGRAVHCGKQAWPYDTLVLATGSEVSWFGHPDWPDAAPGLKTMDDALRLRAHLLDCLHRAPGAAPAAERKRLLTVVLIGGGATGVEMAGSVAELASATLPRPLRAKIILLEAGQALLAGFPLDLAERAAADLQALGVTLRLGTPVLDIRPGQVRVGSGVIVAGTVIWTAGVAATPAAAWLGVLPSKGGRVEVGPDLQPPGRPGIYVIGDAALALGPDGQALPGVAPVAKQQGTYVARHIRRRLTRPRTPMPPFRYTDYGMLAAIGRQHAVADIGGRHLTGRPAWLAWAGAHIFFLIGFRNRLLVSAQWLASYLARRRAA